MEALFSIFDVAKRGSAKSDLVGFAPQGFREIKWLDRRSSDAIPEIKQPHAVNKGEIDDLYENVSEISDKLAGAVKLHGSGGPWMYAVGSTPKGAARAVLLDFSVYPKFDYINSTVPLFLYPDIRNSFRQAIVGWYNDVIMSSFWTIESDVYARTELFTNLNHERKERAVQVWMRNQIFM